MTAYGAVISLSSTIRHIFHSSRISLVDPSLEIIQRAYKELHPLLHILCRLDSTSKSRSRKKVNALDGRIKDTVCKFEDLLESLLSDQIISQFQSPPTDQLQFRSNMHRPRTRLQCEVEEEEIEEGYYSSESVSSWEEEEEDRSSGGERDILLFSIDLQCLRDAVDSFIQTLKDMEDEYIYELENMPEDDDDDETINSSITSGVGTGVKSKMIGLCDQFGQVQKHLVSKRDRRRPLVLVGMAGVGKTTLAKEIYQHPSILTHFECRAWVTVGRKSQSDQALRAILAQLDPTYIHGSTTQGYEEVIERLKGKKCLVVLDDVWEAEVYDSLRSSLRYNEQEGLLFKIMVTARDGSFITSVFVDRGTRVRFMNEEESKDLLCDKVFGEEEICPPQLDKAAAKIAKKCEGLPLLIVTIAGILSEPQNRINPEYWNEVAENRNSAFTDALNEISKVLFPSYDYLPHHLKILFLFLGVFPPDYEIPRSKIINMLTAEGWFSYKNKRRSLERSVRFCLDELCETRNVVLFNVKSSLWHEGVVKTCRLHCSWRHLCREEARKKKFFHVLNRLDDVSEEVIEGQRCLCLQNNILFGIKEFCDSLRFSNCTSSTRSLLFLGPYHQYPTPIDINGFKLLRELDALQLRFYAFPVEILSLVQLKYLALTCNGELPTTISKLFNLRILIIHPHINVRRCYTSSPCIPVQIWDMQKLEHIEILGKSLVAPNHAAASLKKLSTLVGVNANISAILELCRKIPDIEKLGFQIELTPYDDHSDDLLSCFRCTSTLEKLKTIKCSIINPALVVKYGGYVAPATPTSPLMLPHELRKLHLSGMGFPWEYMDVIGSLPYLQVLKLRCYAFRGPTWETRKRSFQNLEFLLIEDSDLVQWKPTSGSFRELTSLSMKHCYKLQELHWPSVRPGGKIELENCNPLAVSCAKQLQPREGEGGLELIVSSSFEDKPSSVSINLQRQSKGEEVQGSDIDDCEFDIFDLLL